MRHALCSILPLLLVCACGPVATFYREGAPVARLASDQTACEVAALRDAPVATEIRQRPPIYYPPRQICNSAGTCYTQPGYWVDGPIYTVDVNKPLRTRVLTQCMADKGYSLISLPRCTQGAPGTAPARLPPIGPDTCAVPDRNGPTRIISPPSLSQSTE